MTRRLSSGVSCSWGRDSVTVCSYYFFFLIQKKKKNSKYLNLTLILEVENSVQGSAPETGRHHTVNSAVIRRWKHQVCVHRNFVGSGKGYFGREAGCKGWMWWKRTMDSVWGRNHLALNKGRPVEDVFKILCSHCSSPMRMFLRCFLASQDCSRVAWFLGFCLWHPAG